MPTNERIQRVRIYLSERDTSAGQPLYLATLERLRREGATGATALRGIAGFGAGHRLPTAGMSDLSQSPPVVIEWVDRAERVARALPTLDELLPNALITIEELEIYRAALRSSGPFGERTVGEVLDRDIATAGRFVSLREALLLLIERGQPVLPLLDQHGALVGIISISDLARRSQLALAPALLGALAAGERAPLLEALAAHPLEEVMGEPRTLYTEAPIPQAVSTLVEWGLDALPVSDRDGRCAGLFGVEQALRAALDVGAAGDSRVRNADPPTPVGLVMQRAVPTIPASAPLSATLAQLAQTAERFLVVVDGWRPIGTLSDIDLAAQLQGWRRELWLESLRSPDAALARPSLDDPDQTAGALARTPAPLVASDATQTDATRQMLDQGIDQLVVVDSEGRLAGLLARRVLLRALAQESAG